MSLAETATYWRYRLIPDHIVGEISCRNAGSRQHHPFIRAGRCGSRVWLRHSWNFPSTGSVATQTRQLGEIGVVVIAMMIVMLAGGIDLSVGSNFALSNITTLALL